MALAECHKAAILIGSIEAMGYNGQLVRTSALSLVMAVAFALYACTGEIHDVRFVSVAPADVNRHLIAHQRPHQNSDLGPLLELQFTTDTDIRDYIKRYDTFVAELVVSPCPLDDGVTFFSEGIYHNDISLSVNPDLDPQLFGLNSDEQAAVRTEDAASSGIKKPHTYDAYFHYGYLWSMDKSGHELVRRPIQGDPPELCFKVEGHSWPWGGFRSNEAIIPRADLAAALAPKH